MNTQCTFHPYLVFVHEIAAIWHILCFAVGAYAMSKNVFEVCVYDLDTGPYLFLDGLL